MLIKGSALLWCDDQEMELSEGGIVFLPRNVPHGYRITSDTADLLMIATPPASKACSATPDGTCRPRAPKASRSHGTSWPKRPTCTARSSSGRRADRRRVHSGPPTAPIGTTKGTTMSRQQRQALDELLRHGPLDLGGDVAEARAVFHGMMTSIPLPPDVSTKEGELGGVPVVTVATPDNDPATVVLYLHGGAYAIGSAADAAGWPAMSPAAPPHAPSVSTTGWLPNTPSPPPSTTPWTSTAPCWTMASPAPRLLSSVNRRAAVSPSRPCSPPRTRDCPSPRRPRSSPRGPT